MRDQDREYWIADGEDRVKVEAFISAREEARNQMLEIAKRYGAEHSAMRGGRLAGLAFEGDKCPKGWREVSSLQFGDRYRPVFYPKRTTKALKAIDADLSSTRVNGALEFTSYMGGRSAVKTGDGQSMRILHMSWEFVGDTLLLSVPTSDDPAKPCFASTSSRKLTMSEYWGMREAADKVTAQ